MSTSGSTPPDGGFFATPIPAQQSYGPVNGGPPTLPLVEAEGVPPLVAGAVTSLALAGIAALWLGLTMLIAGSGVGDYGSGHAGPRGSLLLLNGIANGALVVLVLRGLEPARWAATAICACWVVYWLYQLTRATHAFGSLGFGTLAGSGFGGLTFMMMLGLLLLAAWPAATAAALWTPRSARHFSS